MKPPLLSSTLIDLDADSKTTLEIRMTNALGNNSHSLEMSIRDDDSGSAFDTVSQLISSKDKDFPQVSHALPRKLAAAQGTSGIPGGLLLVLQGTTSLNNHPFVAILKAEKSEGFQRIQDPKKIEIKYLKELFLTPQTRLYKIGIFIDTLKSKPSAKALNVSSCKAFVYDHNLVQGGINGMAIYFYDTFLGLTHAPTAEKLTGDFFTKTKEFISGLEIEAADKVDLETALVTYLKVDKSPTIQIDDFAGNYFEEEYKDTYLRFMVDAGLPMTAFSKDVSRIRAKLVKRAFTFSSGVRLSAPGDGIENRIKWDGEVDGWTKVRIKGELKK